MCTESAECRERSAVGLNARWKESESLNLVDTQSTVMHRSVKERIAEGRREGEGEGGEKGRGREREERVSKLGSGSEETLCVSVAEV